MAEEQKKKDADQGENIQKRAATILGPLVAAAAIGGLIFTDEKIFCAAVLAVDLPLWRTAWKHDYDPAPAYDPAHPEIWAAYRAESRRKARQYRLALGAGLGAVALAGGLWLWQGADSQKVASIEDKSVMEAPLYRRLHPALTDQAKEGALAVGLKDVPVRDGEGVLGYINRTHVDLPKGGNFKIIAREGDRVTISVSKNEIKGYDGKNDAIATVDETCLEQKQSVTDADNIKKSMIIDASTQYAMASERIVFHDPADQKYRSRFVEIKTGTPIKVLKVALGTTGIGRDGLTGVVDPVTIQVPSLSGDQGKATYVVARHSLAKISKEEYEARSQSPEEAKRTVQMMTALQNKKG